MIRILWPTIRPAMMQATYAHWLDHAVHPSEITIKIAVNTPEEREQLSNFDDVIVVGTRRPGPCYAVYKLAQAVEGEPDDIIVVGTDDCYPESRWDSQILKAMEGWDGSLLVADGYQELRDGGVMTIPIMTYGCLLKLNRILNHPLYHCWAADKELYDNLNEMGLVENVRKGPDKITIEHRHWINGKRKKDERDKFNLSHSKNDNETYKRRKRITLKQRIAPLPEGI